MTDKQKKYYLQKINDHFSGLNFESSKLIIKGWDNDVVILDDALVFRFPKREEYKTRFQAEVRLLDRIAERMPVSVPEYKHRPPDLSFGGYEILPGEEMTVGLFKSFNEAAKTRIAGQLGDFLGEVHKTPLALARDCGFEGEPEDYWWSPQHAKATLSGLREKVFPHFDRQEKEWLEYQFAKYLSLSFEFDIVVTHGDLVDDHILVDPDQGRVTGSIDFADVSFSDPALDFAGLWDYGEDFVRQTLSFYNAPVDKDFLARSKFPRLVHKAGNMLEIEDGAQLPITFDQARDTLKATMKSGFTL